MSMLSKWFPFRRGGSVPNKREERALAPMAQLQREMNRVFDQFMNVNEDLWRNPWSALERMDRWFGDYSPSTFTPSVDVADDGTHIKITAELPGLDADDLELDLREGMLVLKGEKKTESTKEEEGYYRTERSYGSFQRAIPLPVEVDAERAEAHFTKGVLTIRLPKLKTTEGRRIAVKAT